jgi:glucose-6-phosphate dehydrogenase assembly protein OpcA
VAAGTKIGKALNHAPSGYFAGWLASRLLLSIGPERALLLTTI